MDNNGLIGDKERARLSFVDKIVIPVGVLVIWSSSNALQSWYARKSIWPKSLAITVFITQK
ncbi:DUF3360 family protein [Vibrio lentus]|nr:DUF3360 family protein [Vibrio lentus]